MKSIFTLLLIALIAPLALADGSDKPLWELGILGGGVTTSDYPGSNESEFRYIVFPNFRYRGEVLRSEETEGTRARIYDNPIYKIDFSFDFNFPVDSSENAARQGMDDVDFVLEIGPRLRIRLATWDDDRSQVFAMLPVRKGLQTDLGYLGDAGWSFSPGVQFSRKGMFCDGCFLFTRVSFSFLDTANANTFYRVDAKDVNANRQAFLGRAGFNATELFMGYVVRVNKFQGFLGLLHTEFSGSVNKESPLLVAERNTTLILGVGWLFWESEKQGFK